MVSAKHFETGEAPSIVDTVNVGYLPRGREAYEGAPIDEVGLADLVRTRFISPLAPL